jgi:leucyl-tRNA synthetase
MHYTIKSVSNDLENFSFNTAVARLMELTNAMIDAARKTDLAQTSLWREVVQNFLILLAPVMPFLAEELWHMIGAKGSVHKQEWPQWDEKALIEKEITLPVQVNGKLRDQLELPADVSKEAAREAAEQSEKVKKFIKGKEVVKFIFVPKRMISFVVK